MGTAGRNMALSRKPLGDIFQIGMGKAAESVGCGNEIEDSIRDKAVKIPSWPLYYSLSNSLLLFSSILSSMFILFYQNNNDKIFFFENKFLIFLGNISYSFYLWHLPTIYFYDLYFINNFFRIPILFITNFILSTLTFLYIEQKFRYKKFNININFKKLIFTASFLALLSITINVAVSYPKKFSKG